MCPVLLSFAAQRLPTAKFRYSFRGTRFENTPGGTRTRNLRMRSPTPCPLGHRGGRNILLARVRGRLQLCSLARRGLRCQRRVSVLVCGRVPRWNARCCRITLELWRLLGLWWSPRGACAWRTVRCARDSKRSSRRASTGAPASRAKPVEI